MRAPLLAVAQRPRVRAPWGSKNVASWRSPLRTAAAAARSKLAPPLPLPPPPPPVCPASNCVQPCMLCRYQTLLLSEEWGRAAPGGAQAMIEVVLNDRLGKKARGNREVALTHPRVDAAMVAASAWGALDTTALSSLPSSSICLPVTHLPCRLHSPADPRQVQRG